MALLGRRNRVMRVSPTIFHVGQHVPENVNDLKQARGFQKKQDSPKVTVPASIPRLPVQNGEDISAEKTREE